MRKACPWASLSTQIHMDSLASNQSLRSEKQEINLCLGEQRETYNTF
jgi:hypothetical protein